MGCLAEMLDGDSAAKEIDLGNPSAPEQWTGYRDLSDDEVKELAEAVVRREAQWVDPSDDITTRPDDLTQVVNKRFGRRFSVVSFRWLSDSEA